MKKYLLFFSFAYCIVVKSSAQNIAPVLQGSHSSNIKYCHINYSNHLLLTANEKEIILWNTFSKKQLRKISSSFNIRDAVLCNNGNEVVFITYDYNKDATLRVHNAANGEELYTLSFAEKNSWGSISYKTLDEIIVDKIHHRIAVRAFNSITIIDLVQRKKAHHFTLNSYNSKFSFTDSIQNFIATNYHDNKLSITQLDTSGKVVALSQTISSADAVNLICNKKQNTFYVLDENATIHVINRKLNKTDFIKSDSVHSVTTYSPPKMALSNNEEILLVPLYKTQYLYNLHKKEWMNNNWKYIYTSSILKFATENNDVAIVISGKYPEIIDVNTGAIFTSLTGKLRENKNMRISPKEDLVSFFNTSFQKTTNILDLKTGTQFNDIKFDNALFNWITDSIVLCTLPEEYDYKSGEFIYTLQIKNIYTGYIHRSISIAKENIHYATISNDKAKIAFINLNNLFVFSGKDYQQKMVYKMPETYFARKIYFTPDSKRLILPTDVIRIYDFDTKKWTYLKDTAMYGYNEIYITPNSKEIWFDDYKEVPKNSNQLFTRERMQAIYVYDIETKKCTIRNVYDTLISSLAIHPSKDLYAIGFFNGTLQVRKRSTDELIYENTEHSGTIDEIIFTNQHSWVYTIGEDGFIKAINYESKKPILTIAPLSNKNEKGFALLTQENYYTIPAALINELHFAKDFETYSFSQLDLQLNRPDKVLEQIGMTDPELLNMYKKALKRRLNKAGYFNNEAIPNITLLQPLIITNRNTIKFNTNNETLYIEAKTTHTATDIKALNIYINGEKIKQLKGNIAKWTTGIQLSEGQNNIEVAYITNNGIESLRERIELTYIPEHPIVSKTYYIGIAVSNYQDSSMNLRYAVKDVHDIANKFQQKDSTAITHLFTNNQVTKNNIKTIRNILLHTTINDKVIISFSGHGLLDTSYNFYFATWDIDFNNPKEKGITFDDINSLLENIPARKKLVLIDACHSGEVDKDITQFTNTANNSDTQYVKNYDGGRGVSIISKKKKNKFKNSVRLMEEYFSDISKDNGANIISAAAGEEYAFESAEWNNGVFSYSFIKGFFEKKADINYDGKITQSEIKKYMQQLVLELTKGRQQPTGRNINTDFDWDL